MPPPRESPAAVPAPHDATESLSTLRWLRAAGWLAAMLPLVVFVCAAWYLYREDVARARVTVDHLALVAEEHAQKVFETNVTLIRRVLDLLGPRATAELYADEPALHEALKRMTDGLPQLQGVFVNGAEGRMVANNRTFPSRRDIDYTDRDWYRHHREGGTQPYVSEYLTSRATGEPFFDVSMRRTLPDGSFGGAISTSLRPDYFQGFYRNLVGAEKASIALVRQDGAVIAAWPDPPRAADRGGGGTRWAVTGSREVTRQALPGGGDGFLTDRAIAGYPVRVVAWMPWSAVVAPWFAQIALVGALLLPIAAGLVFLTRVAEQKTRRSLEAYEELRLESARRQRVEDVLRQAQKLEAVGRLTGGVAHDFNNLLTVVHTNAYLLKRGPFGLGDNAQLAAIGRAVETGTRLTRQLLSFSRAQPLRPETVELQRHLPVALEIIRTAVGSRIHVKCDVHPATAPVRVDTAELELALLNVCINAKDAMPEGGDLFVAARNAPAGEPPGHVGSFVVIEVRDRGGGIPPDVIDHVFEPFFTTKPVGQGTGLGLSQVYGFCVSTGGTALIESRPGDGTTVRLYLPAASEPASAVVDAGPEAAERLDGVHVLLVEDNAEVASATLSVLESAGGRVTRATDADDARRMLRAHRDGFDVVLSDIVMPGTMNGIQLAREIVRERPDLPVVLTTGYSEQASEAADSGFDVLAKPAAPAALIAALRRRLARTVST
jgi:signal transduction histidine kinase/ActR/RegA family two-component response regulator